MTTNDNTVPAKKATREEVEALKKNWVEDPCWDIEHTGDGFEDYHDELLQFRLDKEKERDSNYRAKRINKIEKFRELKLHETMTIGSDFTVMRVVGGWIYNSLDKRTDGITSKSSVISSIFVPYNSRDLHFMTEDLINSIEEEK